jgi:long-chain acyl-CoA synthetase
MTLPDRSSAPWLDRYPPGVPPEIDPDRHRSIVEVLHAACDRFRDRPAFSNMGVTISFGDLQRRSGEFAAFLRKDLGLAKGDRIALQLPNVLQYPVALFGALRAGLVVVNVNPLYTAPEMEHQFRDAGVAAIVTLANFAHKLQAVLPALARSGLAPRVIVSELGDLFPGPKRLLVNAVVRNVKRMVPPFAIPGAIRLRDALATGRSHGPIEDAALSGGDLAFLQYTGGTTGTPKGAMLTHRNIVSNMEQASAWMGPIFVEGEEVVLTPLPLYHIFSLTVNCLLFLKWGALNVLVTNPRDLPAFIKLLRKQRFTVMTTVNTLLNALMSQPGFGQLDFRGVKLIVAGATALQQAVAEKWRSLTKTRLVEGYGLTEASPVVSCNPVDGTDRLGTIGLPLPSTRIRLVAEDGREVAPGEPGEIVVAGPQVMNGYWNRPEETAEVLRGGWLWTGDIARIDEAGFLRIVDRKKDLILVSGFNVYPNEIEDVVSQHPAVAEVGAIGVPDAKSGEVVKIVVVKRIPDVTADELIQFCRSRLAAYKVPKYVEFRHAELPKTTVGKVLRRALRGPVVGADATADAARRQESIPLGPSPSSSM